jgi:LPS export ABC transporter protein LptC
MVFSFYKKYFSLFILTVASVLLFSGCLKPSKTMEEMKPYDGPVMEVEILETTFSESAETTVKLKAPRQWELQNGDREFPNGLLVEFYEQGSIKSTLTANYGKVYKETNKYMVSGNVVIKNLKEERKMTTEEMFWLPSKGENDKNKGRILVDSTKQVIITTKTNVLYGKGLNAAQDLSDYEITHPTGSFNVNQ